jgi:hypothetical protein
MCNVPEENVTAQAAGSSLNRKSLMLSAEGWVPATHHDPDCWMKSLPQHDDRANCLPRAHLLQYAPSDP